MDRNYDVIDTGGAPVKAWTRGVPFEDEAKEQLRNTARDLVEIVHTLRQVVCVKG